ncbi:MAG: adenylate/guanylate cyclase domain-containing protein [Pseudomonadota bacterium]
MLNKYIKQSYLLPLGFALIIFQMIVVTSIGVIRMKENHALMEEVVTQNNVKINLVRNMYIAARERSVLLLEMLALNDPFERDERYLEFNVMATRFSVARMEMKEKILDEYEAVLFKKQGDATRVTAPSQNEVVELIMQEEMDAARDLLFQKAIPGQDKVLESLRGILDYEHKLAKRALENASKTAAETNQFVMFLAVSVILLSFAIAVYVIHITRRDKRLLMQAKDTLEQRVEERTLQLSEAYEDVKQHELETEEKNRELESLSTKLSKYLSPQVYSSIFSGRQEVRLTSQRKKLSVLFIDIVGFTSASDQMEAEDLTCVLNQYLTEMSDIALQHGGTVDKYIGDAIMLFFGDPETRGVKDDALACVKTAIAMQKRLHNMRDQWLELGLHSPITCRIGIHTGYCTVGNFGSETRMDYTIIGGAVNLASRLEHEAVVGGILITSDTYVLVKDEIKCTAMGNVDVRGMAYPVETYKVIDLIESLSEIDDVLQADLPSLKLEADCDGMAKEGKDEALHVLQEAIKRIERN